MTSSPRDRLAEGLAALLPACAVTPIRGCLIRIDFPGLGLVYLAVSKAGRAVEACDERGKAPADPTLPMPKVTAEQAIQIAVDGLIKRCWRYSKPTLRELDALAANGFTDRVPALAARAVAKITAEEQRTAEQIESLQALAATLAAERAAYAALVKS